MACFAPHRTNIGKPTLRPHVILPQLTCFEACFTAEDMDMPSFSTSSRTRSRAAWSCVALSYGTEGRGLSTTGNFPFLGQSRPSTPASQAAHTPTRTNSPHPPPTHKYACVRTHTHACTHARTNTCRTEGRGPSTTVNSPFLGVSAPASQAAVDAIVPRCSSS